MEDRNIKTLKPFKDFLQDELVGCQAYTALDDFFTFKNDLHESDITVELLERLRTYMLERVSNNTAITYFSYIKSAFYKAEIVGYRLGVPYEATVKYLSVRAEASESIYLTRDELSLLEKYEPESKPELFAKSTFLLSAYTGIRISEYPYLTMSNIHNNEIHLTSQKTKRSSRLPMHPSVPQLIKDLEEFNYPQPSATALAGKNIKEICRKIGLDELVTLFRRGRRVTIPRYLAVSSHCGRRTFATLCWLDGYDLNQIKNMLGHSTTRMTENYINSSYDDNITGNRDYFKNKPKMDMTSMKEQLRGIGMSDFDVDEIIKKIEKKL